MMTMKRKGILIVAMMGCWLAGFSQTTGSYEQAGNSVTIHPRGGQARVIQLEVVNDNIIRVRATSKDELPNKPKSLMIVPQQPYKGSVEVKQFEASETNDLIVPEHIIVKAKNVRAKVWMDNGRIEFTDGNGKPLLQEAYDRPGEEPGKQFWDFTVPEREYGLKGGPAITEEMKHGLQWQMKFFSPLGSESFYGLGQHQSEEFNMRGKNEDLFQYNTKVSIPFVPQRTTDCCGMPTPTAALATRKITCS